MNTNYEKIARAIEFVSAHRHEQPELDTIAAAVHTSPFHFQRLFSDWAGISPKKFLQYITIEYAKRLLEEKQHSLFDTAYEAGLSGTGRLHDLFVSIEGMTPGEYKNGGQDLNILYSIRPCRFGTYLVASTGKGICNLHFFDGSESAALEQLRASWPMATVENRVDENQQKVISFFETKSIDKERIRLHLKGSPFQLKVWNALLHIPEGNLATYGHVAGHIDQCNASRAVGTAIGRNPVSYLIPCHRVIKSAGETGGYRWGETRKKVMLGWEAVNSSLTPAE